MLEAVTKGETTSLRRTISPSLIQELLFQVISTSLILEHQIHTVDMDVLGP